MSRDFVVEMSKMPRDFVVVMFKTSFYYYIIKRRRTNNSIYQFYITGAYAI